MKIFKLQIIGMIFALTATMAPAADTFCWKDSTPRGAGTIPTGCDAGKQNQNGLCYAACPAGMTGVGPVCWSGCPAGYTDMGATCHINLPLTVSPSWVCTSNWPGWLGGGCAIWASQCQSGYTNAGLFCALSALPTPAGFSGTYLDPVKNTSTRGAGTIPHGCPAGQVWDAGLCYNPCPSGQSSVGPVCWSHPPSNWVDCGMGAAQDSKTCASTVFSQVSSVGMMAVNIATLGSSDAVEEGVNAAQDASKLDQLIAQFKALKETFDASYPTIAANAPKVATAVSSAATVYSAVNTASNATTPEDIARMSAQIASLIDPSGAAGVVAAYTYPKCSALFH